jgi:hypothetical protein
MGLVEIAAVVAFAAGCAGLFRALLRRPAAPPQGERWEVHHRFDGTVRRVELRRGAEVEPFGAVAPDQPDYEDAFLAIMDRARERASVLNSEG